MLASELLADIRPIVDNEDDFQIQRGDAPFAIVWENDTLMRLAYPGYSRTFDEDAMSPDPMPRDLDLLKVKDEQEFIRYRNQARATQQRPILIRVSTNFLPSTSSTFESHANFAVFQQPWQFRYFELLLRARDVAEC